jgi:hypothetical protein
MRALWCDTRVFAIGYGHVGRRQGGVGEATIVNVLFFELIFVDGRRGRKEPVM